jgi:hypothetical protein
MEVEEARRQRRISLTEDLNRERERERELDDSSFGGQALVQLIVETLF